MDTFLFNSSDKCKAKKSHLQNKYTYLFPRIANFSSRIVSFWTCSEHTVGKGKLRGPLQPQIFYTAMVHSVFTSSTEVSQNHFKSRKKII